MFILLKSRRVSKKYLNPAIYIVLMISTTMTLPTAKPITHTARFNFVVIFMNCC